MLRFLRFKASLNLNNGKTSGVEYTAPGISLNGAYRTNKDELFGSELYTEAPKKISTPEKKIVAKKSLSLNKQSKSTSDLTKPSNAAINVRKSVPDLSPTANNQPLKINIKEQKKLEKQRLVEQKKQEKLAEKERKRAEKLRKETEKQKVARPTSAAETRPKNDEQKKLKKRTAPQPQKQGIAPQVQQQRTPQPPQPTINHQPKNQAPKPPSSRLTQHTTNTLESSISKSSGPPPYSSVTEITPNKNDGTGNTSFANPVEDMDSWGLISQHRQQMNRHAGVSTSATKQKHLDLNYNVGSTRSKESNKNLIN